MYIEKLSVEGFRLFSKEFTIHFNKGLNVLIGENGCGKTSIIDALRLLFLEDEYGRYGISETDFYKNKNNEKSDKIGLCCEFNDLGEQDKLAFLTWLDGNDPSKAKLNLLVENRQNERGYFNKRKTWGGESRSSIFEYAVLDKFCCIYLPPLRDAELKLRAYKGSRLARLFKNIIPKEEQKEHELVEKVKAFNDELRKTESVKDIDDKIRNQLNEATGTIFRQDTSVQFSESSFSKIVESLKLLFYPEILSDEERKDITFRDLVENSLGFNNLIYIATVLAELESLSSANISLKLLLIEEPEAHLHPQLQIKLLQYLQKIAEDKEMQIIITTHSPTITSAIDLFSINVITRHHEDIKSTQLSKCGLNDESKFFLERWLDITKSTLLFSKGVIFVEGIAEALVIPELAKLYLDEFNEGKEDINKLPSSLEEASISVINMNGIFFNHFMQLFIGYNKIKNKDNEEYSIKETDLVPILCAGLTDRDPGTDIYPKPGDRNESKNRCKNMVSDLAENSEYCRLYMNELKTFEYDLAFEGSNLKVLLKIFTEVYKKAKPVLAEEAKGFTKDWESKTDEEKKEKPEWLLKKIDKGIFAQTLAKKLRDNKIELEIPEYIKKAILWVLRGNDEFEG